VVWYSSNFWTNIALVAAHQKLVLVLQGFARTPGVSKIILAIQAVLVMRPPIAGDDDGFDSAGVQNEAVFPTQICLELDPFGRRGWNVSAPTWVDRRQGREAEENNEDSAHMRSKLTKRVCDGQWQVPKDPERSAEWLKVKA
jgi:hypothetical protein